LIDIITSNIIFQGAKYVIHATAYGFFRKNCNNFIMELIAIQPVAEILHGWRDLDTGNNLLHYICQLNDIKQIMYVINLKSMHFNIFRRVVEHCGESLLHSQNTHHEPPFMLLNPEYRPKNAIEVLTIFKEKYNVDLDQLKNSVIDELTTIDPNGRFCKRKYTKPFAADALKLFAKHNMITEDDIIKFDNALIYALETFYQKGTQYPRIDGLFADSYIAALGNQSQYVNSKNFFS